MSLLWTLAIAVFSLTGTRTGAQSGGEAFDPSTRIYVIRPGDTLWGISDRAYKDPWKWPRVWESNPSVANPHLIYPDQSLAIPYVDREAVIAQAPTYEQESDAQPETATAGPSSVVAAEPVVEPAKGEVSAPTPEPAVEEEEEEGGSNVRDSDAADILKDVSDAVGESRIISDTPDKEAPVRPRGMYVRLGSEGMLTTEDHLTDVMILGGPDHRKLYGRGDLVYLSRGKDAGIQVGTRYFAYDVRKEIKHPDKAKKGKVLGTLIQVDGVIEVVAVDEKTSTAKVIESYGSIELRHRLATFEPQPREVVPVYPTRPLNGQVVFLGERRSIAGSYQIVFVDLGKSDGAAVGDLLSIVRHQGSRKDLLKGEDHELPLLDVGVGVVLDVQEHASTVLVVRAMREIVVGDRVTALKAGS